jgi:WD40 repeat protein
VRLWNLASGRLRRPVLQAGSGSHGGANAVAFSLDGKLLASADADGTVRLWDPATGQLVGSPLQAGGSVFGVAFGPDGKLAGADVDGAVLVWYGVGHQATGPDSSSWFIAVASAIALALSVSAMAIITHEIRLARSVGQRT